MGLFHLAGLIRLANQEHTINSMQMQGGLHLIVGGRTVSSAVGGQSEYFKSFLLNSPIYIHIA